MHMGYDLFQPVLPLVPTRTRVNIWPPNQLQDSLMMNCLPIRLSNIADRGSNRKLEWVYARQETLTKITRSTLDPSIVLDSGSALVKLSSIVPIPLPWKICKKKSWFFPYRISYGKSPTGREVGITLSTYEFQLSSQERLSFYTFGSGEERAVLDDVRVVKGTPTVECSGDLVKVSCTFCKILSRS